MEVLIQEDRQEGGQRVYSERRKRAGGLEVRKFRTQEVRKSGREEGK